MEDGLKGSLKEKLREDFLELLTEDDYLDHVGRQLLDPDLYNHLGLRLVPVIGDPVNQSQFSIQVT